MKWAGALSLAAMLLASCAAPTAQPGPALEPRVDARAQEEATLASLELVDDHPLYVMHFVGSYGETARLEAAQYRASTVDRTTGQGCPPAWGCSLFAALGGEDGRVYGRNFDWEFSPALLLFTDAPDGYASVSMVDIKYLGFEGERSRHIQDLPLDERRPLLAAPFLPFDGMNEKGLAVGMAAVPAQEMPNDPRNPTIDSLEVIREMLDHAATVEEAIGILAGHNIDMGNVPLHYLIASSLGQAAVVEFYEGQMVVFRSDTTWQTATNFLIASTNGNPQGQCERYDRISRELSARAGRISPQDALHLLEQVAQEGTQWSVVYNMASGGLNVVMGRDYDGAIHEFNLQPGGR